MKIVTDSSVMFSVEDGARRGMTVLPLVVAIDGQTWLEYEDISAEEFLAKVRAGALPQSASPPPALTLAAYDTDDEVIHLAMADGLSGAYEVACGLVKQARHPERVQVVNTRTLCVPHRVLACTAVQLAGQGLDAAAVLEALDAQIATAHSYLIPEDFDYLRRGGRLTPLAATFAHLVKAFPVMKQTDDGTRLEKMKVARSFAKAVNAIADDLEARGVGEGFFLSVSHADNPSQAGRRRGCWPSASRDAVAASSSWDPRSSRRAARAASPSRPSTWERSPTSCWNNPKRAPRPLQAGAARNEGCEGLPIGQLADSGTNSRFGRRFAGMRNMTWRYVDAFACRDGFGREIAPKRGRGRFRRRFPTIREFAGTRRRPVARSRSLESGKAGASRIARQMRESERMS